MTKSTITRDQLRALAVKKVESLKFAITQSAFTNIRRGLEEELQLAEFALAAMDSEPVAYTDERNLGYIDGGRETAYLWGKQNSEASDVALYRHAQPVPEKYNIGDATMRHIFTPTGMTNVSDMQAVFDRVEAVLVGMEQPAPVVPDDVLDALQKVARIRLDMNDFDGDRRGIADCLCDAEEALIEVVNRRAAMLNGGKP